MANLLPPKLKRSQRDYTMGFKLSVVEQVEKGQLTYKQAQRKYGIQGRSTVLVWLRKHGRLDWSSTGGHMIKQPETPRPNNQTLRKGASRRSGFSLLASQYAKDNGPRLRD